MRELGLVVLGGVLLAVLMHFPLVLHLGTDIPKDIGDPLYQAWQLGWGGHALLHQPLDFFQANIWYPEEDSLAFADALVGYAPLSVFADGPKGAVFTHNVLFHLTYAMSFVGGYLLARELGAGPVGAVVAGIAFAYAPYRIDQDSRLNILASGGIPLSIFLGLRGYRQSRPGLVVAGFLVAGWQLTLGNNLGLMFLYLLGVLAVIAAIYRPRLPRPMVIATVVGLAAFALIGYVHARPYLDVRADHGVVRSLERVDFYSTAPRAFLAASDNNMVWGHTTASVRDDLDWIEEQTMFPGLAIVALALVGLFGSTYPRALRIGLGVGTVLVAWLSLGLTEDGSRLLYPYRILYDIAPGWDGVRVPERLHTLTTLGLALLAGAGAATIASRARRVPLALTGVVLAGVVLIEGSGFGLTEAGEWKLRARPHPTVPVMPAAQRGLPEPQLHLPAETGEESSPRFVLWSTDGFPRIVNGLGSLQPESYTRVQEEAAGFPDRRSVALLRSMGVNTVVLHTDLVVGTPWEGWALRPVDGLPITRERRDGLVIYDLR